MRPSVISLVIAAAFAFADTAYGAPLDEIYDDRDLGPLLQRYQRGWRDSLDRVFNPVFTPEERARLANVQFQLNLRVPKHEPFGFLAGGNTILASTASLKFLEDISLAYVWTNRRGFQIQTIGDYLMMLRYWDSVRGRPPSPLEALCIPRDTSEDPRIAEQASRAFNSAATFVLLHEYGHIFHRHPGNKNVPSNVSRANEAAADRFALDMFARVGDVPIGVAIFFFTMSYLHENRADFGSDGEYQQSLAGRTHPVSPERLQAFARVLSTSSGSFDRGFLPDAKGHALLLGLEVAQLALLLGNPRIQRLSASIGVTVRPDDLGPRPKGRHLAAPCKSRPPSGRPFDGSMQGQAIVGGVPLDIDAVLERDADRVIGSYSYGAGFGRLDGTVRGATLNYRWALGADRGVGAITLQGDSYRGAWGPDASPTSGSIELRRVP